MALACGSLPAVAQDPSPWSEVIVRTIDADSLRGRLTTLSLARGAVLHIPTEGKLNIPITDLVRVTLVDGRISTPTESDREHPKQFAGCCRFILQVSVATIILPQWSLTAIDVIVAGKG